MRPAAPAFPRLAIVVLAVLGAAATLGAVEVGNLDSRSDEEISSAYQEERSEAAANYRLTRARIMPTLPAEYHAGAAAELERAAAALVEGEYLVARQTARQALKRWPYAERAAELVHVILRTHAIGGEMNDTRRTIIDLWERFPEYPAIRVAMEETLIAAETLQRLGMETSLDADQPQQVVRVSDNYFAVGGPIKLFYFLRDHGDRRRIAPRASLGIARALLAKGTFSKEALFAARLAYDDFLTTYPDHPLVFKALLEQAVSYLMAYRGAKYDVGVLIFASGIIDQAEIYTEEKPERIALVKRYRQLIRRYHQERDLFTAEWYHEKGRYAEARYYYRQVMGRDASSPPARTAKAAMETLPAPDDRPLGDPVPPAAADTKEP